ncbi:MAG: hypothetical protein QM783_03635 [Phycisphaerales bacterium]
MGHVVGDLGHGGEYTAGLDASKGFCPASSARKDEGDEALDGQFLPLVALDGPQHAAFGFGALLAESDERLDRVARGAGER